ncbi:MAG TPA: heparinase II/III family protein [Gemmatimonadales bacterium]|nr:heparinase II/III family protein [Gemmatimonadales bacterium]
MLTAAELSVRREALGPSPDLSALIRRLAERAAPLLARRPPAPRAKALLSTDGGFCPQDRSPLRFDPWSPSVHRCPRCGCEFTGERHDLAWARYQHLWLAERAATLATLASLADHQAAAGTAQAILIDYAGAYLEFPNRDNVLGPGRLFFSTYLESIWLTDYLSAAVLLRESGQLSPEAAEGVNQVADEAANLIGEFDEGLSNRQTWHNAALTAAAVWFEDEELATRTVEGPTGILAHLLQGFRDDGMWFEGENYHLFALRGQLLALGWARWTGVDLLADERLALRLHAALRAPAVTALPDHTFPARKDSRFGVSLAQPMYLELWEVGLARLGRTDSDLWGWLRELYSVPAPPAQPFDSYLHEMDEPPPDRPRTRADLSWWSLLEMMPAMPEVEGRWAPGSVLLEQQGLAVLREGDRYTSLECGAYGGGHGHPDRLHLTLHAGGCHWLADPGTGSYVDRDLFWYRSTLAHNAPRLDGVSQPPVDARCTNFDVQGDWSWARGSYGALSRTLVSGPHYLLDLLDLSADEEHLLEVPWHLDGTVEVLTAGGWAPDQLADEFVSSPERFTGDTADAVVLRASAPGSAAITLRLHLDGGQLLRAVGPGRPGQAARQTFYLVRTQGRNARLVAVLEPAAGAALVQALRVEGELVQVEHAEGVDSHLPVSDGWEMTLEAGPLHLAGGRRPPVVSKPLINPDRPLVAHGVAAHVPEPPALDGTLEGFTPTEPMALDYEDQYRRSEEPYPGPEELSATVLANWDESALYLGIEVVKSEVIIRAPDSPPLRLDNELDDIHADGVQVYLRPDRDGPVYGFLVVPGDEDGAIRVHPVSGYAGAPEMVDGGWQGTETGYSITLGISVADWRVRGGDRIPFDLLVNEMRPGRLRRAGQLVWSGGGGWVYLRGDRQPETAFGVLELE